MIKRLLLFTCAACIMLSTCQKTFAFLQDPGGTLSNGGFIYTFATIPYSIAKKPQEDDGKGIVNVSQKKNLDVSRLKKGTSSCIKVYSIIELGDAGIYQAAKSAGIKTIYYVDVIKEHLWGYYMWYDKLTTVVYGE